MYTVTERKIISIVESLKESRTILLGQILIICTEHTCVVFFWQTLHLPWSKYLVSFKSLFFLLFLVGVTCQESPHLWSTIDPAKQGFVIIKRFFIRVINIPPPPLCTPHHEPIVGIIYHIFIEIIVKIILGRHLPSDALVCQPDIDHIHRKNR